MQWDPTPALRNTLQVVLNPNTKRMADVAAYLGVESTDPKDLVVAIATKAIEEAQALVANVRDHDRMVEEHDSMVEWLRRQGLHMGRHRDNGPIVTHHGARCLQAGDAFVAQLTDAAMVQRNHHHVRHVPIHCEEEASCEAMVEVTIPRCVPVDTIDVRCREHPPGTGEGWRWYDLVSWDDYGCEVDLGRVYVRYVCNEPAPEGSGPIEPTRCINAKGTVLF